MYSVYKHTAPNGKVYIGITQQEPEARWKNGNGYRNNVLFFRAINKYGWENIDHEILFEGLTKAEAFETERKLIARHRSSDKRFGYNITDGGANVWWAGKKRPLSPQGRKNLSKKWLGANNPKARSVICLETLQVYETASEAAKATGATKISECCNRAYKHRTSGGYHWAFYDEGKPIEYYSDLLASYIDEEQAARPPMTEENKRKLVERCAVPILCVETGEVFASIADASEATGANKPNICNCCKGNRKTAGGFHWRYAAKGASYA